MEVAPRDEAALERRDESFDLALAVLKYDQAETDEELMHSYIEMRDRARRLVAKIARAAVENGRS